MAMSILLPPISSSTPNRSHKIKNPKRKRPKTPPISISTNPSHLNAHHLQHLFFSSNFSCHRFPALSSDDRPGPVDVDKLRTAVAHSAVVVSVFCREKFLKESSGDPAEGSSKGFGFKELFERMAAVPDEDHRLVGFGRAVSDGGLTASIHDVVVIPSMRRLGVGRKIVGKIIRILTSRGIYDISALCSEKERLFFEACGFGEDSLGSTTMMYTQTVSSFSQDNVMIRPAGRMLLLIPPTREPCPSKRIAVKEGDSIKNPTEVL